MRMALILTTNYTNLRIYEFTNLEYSYVRTLQIRKIRKFVKFVA